MTIKQILITVITLVIVSLSISTYYLNNKVENLNEEISLVRANEKAYMEENNSLKDNTRVLQYTIDQLNWANDSITKKLNDTRKDLKIKDSDIKNLQYQLSEAKKTDTIIFEKVIFKDPSIQIDTTLGDKWYNVRLGLQYPSTVAITPTFISEKVILTTLSKETIKPPKKCKIARWFQKKHKVLKVEVVESNPYINNKQFKQIKIIDD